MMRFPRNCAIGELDARIASLNGITKEFGKGCSDPAMVLVTNSQDVEATLESIGKPELSEEYGGLFAYVGDGEYLAVWGFCGSVPFNNKTAYRISLR